MAGQHVVKKISLAMFPIFRYLKLAVFAMSFLCIGFLVGTIGLLEKNDVDELVAAESMFRAQGDSQDQIDAQISLMQSAKKQARAENKRQSILIIVGTILGGALSFVATDAAAKRAQNHTITLRNRDISDDIIGASLKFVLSQGDVINTLWADKDVLDLLKKTFPEKASSFESDMIKRFDRKTETNFFDELMFHSFQLRRLDDDETWKKFEQLVKSGHSLTRVLLGLEKQLVLTNIDSEYKNLKKAFIDRCVNISKV